MSRGEEQRVKCFSNGYHNDTWWTLSAFLSDNH